MIRRIPGLDGLRALSFGMVLALHLGLAKWSTAHGAAWATAGKILTAHGVTIFFVLSGFLITTLLLRERDATGRIALERFFLRRCLRILPCYGVFLLVVALLMAWRILGIRWGTWAQAAVFTYNFIPRQSYASELGPLWSLAVEEHFYIVWPVLLALTPRGTRWPLAAALAALAASLAGYVVVLRLDPWSWSPGYFTDRWTPFAMWQMQAGCALAAARAHWGAAWSRVTRTLWTPVAGLALFCAAAWLPRVVPSPVAEICGIVLLLDWLIENPTAWFTRALEQPLLVWLGTRSFGLYVWHGLFVRTHPEGTSLWMQRFPVNVALTLLVAEISYHLVETPFLRLKQRLDRRATPPLASGPMLSSEEICTRLPESQTAG